MTEGQFAPPGEFRTMPTKVVTHKANLAIGKPGEGRVISDITEPEHLEQFGGQLESHTAPFTVENTMDCMEDRPWVGLADGTTDPTVLKDRVVAQWPGGMVLATTKAAVAADAAYLRDATSFTDAYLLTNELLKSLGYEDGGHAACGASGLVEVSVAEPVVRDIAVPTVAAVIGGGIEDIAPHFDTNSQHKQRKLEAGFFSDWSQEWHETFLADTVPHNFSYIKTADDPTHGHYAKAAYAVIQAGHGFAKNAFYDTTGNMAFAVTPPKVEEIAFKIGGTPEERQAILVGFATDLLDVSDKIVGPGLPFFGQDT